MNIHPSSPPMPRVLVLGGNGGLGRVAAEAFDTAGWHVVAQVRRDALPGLSSVARVVQRPLDDIDAIVAAAGAASVVVHAVNPVYTRWQEEALPALRLGLDIAERLGARFMLPGNVYNYGTTLPARLTEATPFRPDTPKAAIRVEMEALMRQRASAGGFTASVVRAGDFFGGGRGNWFDQAIVKSLADGKLVYPGPLDLPHAWAYLPDLAREFVRIAALPRPASFDVSHFEGHTATGAQFLAATEAAATALGRAPAGGWRRAGMPWRLVAAIGVVKPAWRELARMSYLWRTPHALVATSPGGLPRVVAATPLRIAVERALRDLGFGPTAAGAGAAAMALR